MGSSTFSDSHFTLKSRSAYTLHTDTDYKWLIATMSSFEPHSLSRTYVLRCWVEPQLQPSLPAPAWRFRLENPHDKQTAGFATVDDLVIFLQETFDNNERIEIKESK